MAHGKDRPRAREENGSMRTWQGIVILVAIAVILCAGLYIFAYKAGYLPLPPYLLPARVQDAKLWKAP